MKHPFEKLDLSPVSFVVRKMANGSKYSLPFLGGQKKLGKTVCCG